MILSLLYHDVVEPGELASSGFPHGDARMSHCSPEQLLLEWEESARVLSNILGDKVRVASVPGGYYSKRVAEAAASSGIEVLFNSEPTSRIKHVKGCMVLGRYSIQQGV